MALDKEQFIADYSAFQSVSLEQCTEIAPAEDTIAENFVQLSEGLSPEDIHLGQQSWQYRQPLKDALKGKFLGRLTDITIERMEDPYAALLQESAKEASRKASAGAAGFIISATLKSCSEGDIGNTQRPVWILPRHDRMYEGLYRRFMGKEQGDNRLQEAHKASVRRAGTLRGYSHAVPKSRYPGVLPDGSR